MEIPLHSLRSLGPLLVTKKSSFSQALTMFSVNAFGVSQNTS